MAVYKHCCPSLITVDDHTDYCLSRQTEIERLKAENEALRWKVDGQAMLLTAYRLGTRPPERAFTLLEQAEKRLTR